MPINHTHKFIFTHVTKTGGSSLYTLFNMKNVSVNSKHYTSKQNKMVFRRFWNTYFKFAFVRNPYMRFISAFYYHIHMVNTNQNPHMKIRQIIYGHKHNINSLIDLMRKDQKLEHSIKTSIHFLPQTSFLSEKMDFIGRFENYDEDVKTILKKLNVTTSPEIPHELKTNHE